MKKRPPYLTNDPYAITPDELIIPKLQMLSLKDNEVLLDLGAGNAANLIAASNIAKVKCIGYEVLPEALTDAQKNILRTNLSDQIEMRSDDFFLADLSEADAIILYLSRHMLGPLSIKLEKELRTGTRIVTHQFDLPAWTAIEEQEVMLNNGQMERLYLYRKD